MTLIGLIIILVVIGVLMWMVNTYIPMQESIRTILNIVVVIVVLLWLLNIFGVIGGLNVPIERVR